MSSVYAMCNLPAMNHNIRDMWVFVGYKIMIHSCLCTHFNAFKDISMYSTMKTKHLKCIKPLHTCEVIHSMNQCWQICGIFMTCGSKFTHLRINHTLIRHKISKGGLIVMIIVYSADLKLWIIPEL